MSLIYDLLLNKLSSVQLSNVPPKMARRIRKQSTRGTPHPVDPVFEIFQRLAEAPPTYPGHSSKSNRTNRKARATRNYNLTSFHMERSTTDGTEPARVSYEFTFAPDATRGPQTAQLLDEYFRSQSSGPNELIDILQPMMMGASSGSTTTGTVPSKTKKEKNKKTPKEDDPFEVDAKKLWESMSDKMSCSCRKAKLLEALQKDRETLVQNETHLRAQIGSYKMFQSVMSDEFEKQDVGIVLVVDNDAKGQSAMRYKLEKKSNENSGSIEALEELTRQLKAYL